MKKRIFCFLLCVCLLCTCSVSLAQESIWSGDLFDSNTCVNMDLAFKALELSGCYSQQNADAYFQKYGFDILVQKNYDKAEDDPSHTCAFTIAQGEIECNSESRPLILTVIRPTAAAEWISNFDVAPSRSEDTPVSENFYLSAVEVADVLLPIIEKAENPLVLVTGFSRGAACANLVGVLLDSTLGQDDLYIYTFACPATIHGGWADGQYTNIFNFINPLDFVTLMPLKAWQFTRAGTDIVLPADESLLPSVQQMETVMSELAPSITSYYNDKHNVMGKGLSDAAGISVFEFMQMFYYAASGKIEDARINQAMGMLQKSSNDFTDLMQIIAAGSQGGDILGLFSQHNGTVYADLMNLMLSNP